jgi:hypothetical protein
LILAARPAVLRLGIATPPIIFPRVFTDFPRELLTVAVTFSTVSTG